MVYASPLWISPPTNEYEVEFSPPKIVHVSHIEMTKHTDILFDILSPFLSRIDKKIKRNEGKKRRYEQGYDA